MRASLTMNIISAILYLSTIGFGETVRCPTCRGNACNEKIIPLAECDLENNKLPFNFQLKHSELTEFFPVCVELEYVNDRKVTPVKQCLLVTSENYLCSEVVESLPRVVRLTNCWVNENKEKLLKVREVDDDIAELQPDQTEFDVSSVTSPQTTEEMSTTLTPTTEELTEEKPTTVAPTTEESAEGKPTTLVSTTEKPIEEKSTSLAPSTEEPIEGKPTTLAPTTEEPTEGKPTTLAPTTEEPTEGKPTTLAPTTEEPTEREPTTLSSTTLESTESVSVTTVEVEVTTQGSSIVVLSLLTISIALCIQIVM